MIPLNPSLALRSNGLDRCAAALRANVDRVVLAEGEGARRLALALASQEGDLPTAGPRGHEAFATALGEAAAGRRVALLVSGRRWTSALAGELAALRRARSPVVVVVPSHGDESGRALPDDDLTDLRPLLAAALPLELVARPAELFTRTTACLRGVADHPVALAFSLQRCGLAPCLDDAPGSNAPRIFGDPSAPTAVVGAGVDLEAFAVRVAQAGGEPLRAIEPGRLRPRSTEALAEALRGALRVTVLEPFPDALGDPGWLTQCVVAATTAPVRVIAPGCDPEDSTAFEEPAARDLSLMPLAVRRRLDLAGLHLSLDTWRALDLVTRSSLRDLPAERPDLYADHVRAVCAEVGASPGEIPPSESPWDRALGFALVHARAAELGVALDLIAYQSLPVQHRFALHHLAHPRRAPGRLQAALAAALTILP